MSSAVSPVECSPLHGRAPLCNLVMTSRLLPATLSAWPSDSGDRCLGERARLSTATPRRRSTSDAEGSEPVTNTADYAGGSGVYGSAGAILRLGERRRSHTMYPAPEIAATNTSAGTALTSTVASPAARSTFAARTPGVEVRARSMVAAHDPQDIPPTARCTVSGRGCGPGVPSSWRSLFRPMTPSLGV